MIELSGISKDKSQKMNTEKNRKGFSRYFSVYSGTFDSFDAFEYNYDRNSKEAAKWVIS